MVDCKKLNALGSTKKFRTQNKMVDCKKLNMDIEKKSYFWGINIIFLMFKAISFLAVSSIFVSCSISRSGSVSSSGHFPIGTPKVILGTVYGKASNTSFCNFTKPQNNSLVAKAKRNLNDEFALDTGMYFVNFTTDMVEKRYIGLVFKTDVVVSADVVGHPNQINLIKKEGIQKEEVQIQQAPLPLKERRAMPFYFLNGKIASVGDSLADRNELYLVYYHNKNNKLKSKLVQKEHVVFNLCENDNTLKRCGMKMIFNYGDQKREGVFAGENDKYLLIKTNEKNSKMVIRPKLEKM